VPTISEAASNSYNAAADTLSGNTVSNKSTTGAATFDTGSHLHDYEKQSTPLSQSSTTTAYGTEGSVSNTVANAYTAASNALSRATNFGSTSTIQHNTDLESGLEKREINPSSTSSYEAQTQSSTGIVPTISRTVNNVYDSVANTIAPNEHNTTSGVQNSATSNNGIIPSITNGATQLYNQASSAVANTISGEPTTSRFTHESRPLEGVTSNHPTMTTTNNVPVAAEFNQSTPATSFGKFDLPRGETSQASAVVEQGHQSHPSHSGSTTQDVMGTGAVTRPHVQSMDTSESINITRYMPGSFYFKAS